MTESILAYEYDVSIASPMSLDERLERALVKLEAAKEDVDFLTMEAAKAPQWTSDQMYRIDAEITEHKDRTGQLPPIPRIRMLPRG